MAVQEIYRGRLIDHLQLVVRNLEASKKFYTAVLRSIGIEIGGEGPGFFWADELFVSTADSPAAQGKFTGPSHFAFQASNKAAVDRFYQLGLEAGGKSNGAPGERPYHPGYYAAFLLDPDGNNVEAVYHGQGNKSAGAIKITFEM